ncbi:MAG: glycosyltransferase family 2 protein, partial [Cyclobacteriaceae bacterium]|nr:glycosyltransferase family 2 protein [Cyclobacteriaceae bacterium]
VVVIPSYDEPGLITCLESLFKCLPTRYPVEIIVVINFTVSEPEEKKVAFERSFHEAQRWANDHSVPHKMFHILHAKNLPEKSGGVGLARKIGMDEAARRLHNEGAIICLDADCTVQNNYLMTLEDHFRLHPRTPGCSIYYEHPLESAVESTVHEGITRYELFLRYYVQAQRFSGFPYAYQTVGSSMAVRSGIYKKQGGMNTRKAGEDFYFLSKIIPLGNFTEVRDTTVFPSSRTSQRVPFGTGKAMIEWNKNEEILTYPLGVFVELKTFFSSMETLFKLPDTQLSAFLSTQGDCIGSFLSDSGFGTSLASINRESPSLQVFRKHFFHWFNSFRIMKYMHFACNSFYSRSPVIEEAYSLLRILCPAATVGKNARALLQSYREIDKGILTITS